MTSPPSSPAPFISIEDLFPSAVTAYQNLSTSLATLRAAALRKPSEQGYPFCHFKTSGYDTGNAYSECRHEEQQYIAAHLSPLLQHVQASYEELENEKRILEEQDTGLDEEAAIVDMIQELGNDTYKAMKAAHVLYKLSKMALEPELILSKLPSQNPLPAAAQLADKLDGAIDDAIGKRDSCEREESVDDAEPLFFRILASGREYYQQLLHEGYTHREARAMVLYKQHWLTLQHMVEPLEKAQKICAKFVLHWKAVEMYVRAGGKFNRTTYELVEEDIRQEMEQMEAWEDIVWKAAKGVLKAGNGRGATP